MVSSVVSNPTERLVSHRADEEVELGEDASYTRKSRSKVVRRVLATVVVLSFLVGVSVLSYFVVTKYKSISEFKSGLSAHLSKNFPELEMQKRDHYFDELTHLYRSGLVSKDHKLELEVYMEFESFNSKYHRFYRFDQERRDKFVNFRKSYLEVKDQKGDKLYTKGINRFSDLSEGEFYKLFTPLRVPKSEILPPKNHILNIMDNLTYLKNLKLAKNTMEDIDINNLSAEDLDWRRANAVRAVKDQGRCGCGWAMSAVDCVESFFSAHYDKVYDLSVQQVVNCDDYSFGCDVGFVESALSYIRKYGLVLEDQFPYVAKNGQCYIPETDYDRIYINSFYVFRGKDVFNKSLLVSPTVVYLAVSPELASYSGGIYTGPCSSQLNTPVLLVGEGLDEATQKRYWIIKTSWGPHWGEEGYLRLERTGEGTDKCGVLDTGLHPFAF